VAKAGRAGEIQRRPAADEVPRSRRLAVHQARADQRVVVPADPRQVHARAVAEQHVDHGQLHARELRRHAGGHERERGAAAAVDVGAGVDLRAGLEQQLGDAGGVLGALLAVALDAVRGDVVEQRGVVFARRTRAWQLGVFAQQTPQRRLIALDDRVHGGLERRDLGARAGQRFDVGSELRPAEEAVRARDHELRVGQRALFQLRPGELREARGLALDALARRPALGSRLMFGELLEPGDGPAVEGHWIARARGLQQRFRALLVLLEARMRRERQRVLCADGHANLLSTPPGVRPVRLKEGSVS
jgi:hypothetical protein